MPVHGPDGEVLRRNIAQMYQYYNQLIFRQGAAMMEQMQLQQQATLPNLRTNWRERSAGA